MYLYVIILSWFSFQSTKLQSLLVDICLLNIVYYLYYYLINGLNLYDL